MTKIDDLLKRVERFEKLAVYGDRSAFLKSLAQDNASYQPFIGSDSGGDHPGAAGPNYFAPDQKSPTSYPPISRELQEMLSRITTVQGLGLPLQIDGSLGPETKKALDAFRRKFNVPGNFSDAEALQVVKNTYSRDPGQYGNLSAPGNKTPSAPTTPAQSAPARNPGDPLPPMGPGLQGIVTNTRATGIGEHAGNVPNPNVRPSKT